MKHYVSPIDIKLAEFDAIHQPSDSQEAEIAKYQRIYGLRDKKVPLPKKTVRPLWEKF